jgi:hypothetical protein
VRRLAPDGTGLTTLAEPVLAPGGLVLDGDTLAFAADGQIHLVSASH